MTGHLHQQLLKWSHRFTCVLALFMAAPANAQVREDLLNDDPQFSPFNLELRPYVTLPSANRQIISMTTRAGDSRLYVTTQDGMVFTASTGVSGMAAAEPWFDFGAAQTALGHPLNGNAGQSGLQSLAFHPQFEQAGSPGYGKLYTTMVENRPTNTAGHHYLGDSANGIGIPVDGVLAEWTYNHEAGAVETNSYRELFRVNMPVYDHPIKQARFNPYAQPGDADYGLLYMTHGDSNVKHSPNDDPQHLGNVLGKMIRIGPLQNGEDRYTIPASNPFANSNDPNVLQEIYAYGFRNPHTFSFNPDDHGGVHILAGDIGRNNIEEIDLIVPGGNFGWPDREGTFVHRQLPDNNPDAGYITGVTDLPANEADLGLVYPVAQYDHNAAVSEVTSGNAIASGFVIRNGSDPNLHNQLIFNNFADQDGIVYHADFDEMLDAVTQLKTGEDPSALQQATLHKFRLALDHDNDPGTPPQIFEDIRNLINAPRSDTRYGEGVFGEMYISSKLNGTIYLVTNSVPLAGDYNRNGTVDAADYTVWRHSLEAFGYHLPADGNGNGTIDTGDYDVWRANFGRTRENGGLAASVAPEPTAGVLSILALAGLVSLACRQHQKTWPRFPPDRS